MNNTKEMSLLKDLNIKNFDRKEFFLECSMYITRVLILINILKIMSQVKQINEKKEDRIKSLERATFTYVSNDILKTRAMSSY